MALNRAHEGLLPAAAWSWGGMANKLINNDFRLFQRGTSIAITAGSAAYVGDRWRIQNDTNQTVTVSQQDLTLGALFNSKKKMRLAFSVAPTTGNLIIEQRIEDVLSVQGKTCSARIHMTGPTGTETLACSVNQNFGTGGSPSSAVPTAAASLDIATIYNASETKRRAKIIVPSVSGKVLGSGNNDYLGLLWTLTPRQVGNYEVWRASFVEGDAFDVDDPGALRHPQEEQALCQRYYETGVGRVGGYPAGGGAGIYYEHSFNARKRDIPTLTYTPSANVNVSTYDARDPSVSSFRWYCISAGSAALAWEGTWTAASEL